MRFYFICFIFLIVCFSSCSTDSQIIELGNGYFLRSEGANLHDILNHSANHKDIPPDIVEYNYNRDFIIVAQHPKEYDNAIYNNFPEYPFGRDTIYYWLIVKDLDLELGPLSKMEFNNAKFLYKVDKNLQLKPVN